MGSQTEPRSCTSKSAVGFQIEQFSNLSYSPAGLTLVPQDLLSLGQDGCHEGGSKMDGNLPEAKISFLTEIKPIKIKKVVA